MTAKTSPEPKAVPDELYVMTKTKKLLLLLSAEERARVITWINAVFP